MSIKEIIPFTPAIKLFNLPNGDSSFREGKLTNNVKIEAGHFWFQNHIDHYETIPHPAPRVQYVITLKGRLRFTVTDGSNFIVEPGVILIAADTLGGGHSWELLDGDEWHRIYIPIDGGEEKYFIADEIVIEK